MQNLIALSYWLAASYTYISIAKFLHWKPQFYHEWHWIFSYIVKCTHQIYIYDDQAQYPVLIKCHFYFYIVRIQTTQYMPSQDSTTFCRSTITEKHLNHNICQFYMCINYNEMQCLHSKSFYIILMRYLKFLHKSKQCVNNCMPKTRIYKIRIWL